MSAFKEENSENKEIKHLLFQYLQKWHYFLIALLISGIGAYTYLWFVTPQYNIIGKILVEDKKGSLDGANNILAELDIFKPNKIIENEIEVINSRSLISKTLAGQEFNALYKKVESVKSTEVYKKCPFVAVYDSLNDSAYSVTYYIEILSETDFSLTRECYDFQLTSSEKEEFIFKFGDTITTRFGDFKVIKRSGIDFSNFSISNENIHRHYSIDFRKESDNISFYKEKLKISLASKSSTVLVLSIQYPLIEKGEDFINSLMDIYIQDGIEVKNKVASNTLEFIEGRLDLIVSDLTGIESGIEKYKSDKGIADLGEEAKIFLQTVREYDEQLSQINIQISFVEYLEAYLKNDIGAEWISPSVAGISDPVLYGLLEELNKMEAEKQRLRLTTKEDNPVYKILNKQISAVKKSISENITSYKKNLNITGDALKKIVSGFDGQIRKIPKTERELVDIQRQQNIKEKLYLYLLQKQEETSIALASTVSDNRIIDRAHSSDEPVSPVKRNIVLIAFALGLAIPAVIISLTNYFSDKVTSREQIEAITSAPIIGTIGKSYSDNIIAINEKAKSSISEEFRAIRTNLQYVAAGSDQKVILITSSMSGEGKTFISLNMGMTLAISGKKTVVLELDLRKPKLSINLGLNNDKGISNFLAGACSENELIKNSGVNSMLDIIGSGPIPPNPAELLLSIKFDSLISFLKTKYDYILIDSPPVGLVSDSLVISRIADISIYIVRQGYTRENNLLTIKELFESKQLNKLSVIFNDVTNKYGYYGYGGYGGYGYGYYEEAKSKKDGFFNKILFWKK